MTATTDSAPDEPAESDPITPLQLSWLLLVEVQAELQTRKGPANIQQRIAYAHALAQLAEAQQLAKIRVLLELVVMPEGGGSSPLIVPR